MKKIIFVLSMLILSMVVYCQSDTVLVQNPVGTIQETVESKIITALKMFIDSIDWFFMLIFIVTTGIVNMYIKAENKALWLNKVRKIWTALWVLIYGIVLAIVYGIIFKANYFSLFITIFISMGVYKIGIDRLMKMIAKKFLGIKFDEK